MAASPAAPTPTSSVSADSPSPFAAPQAPAPPLAMKPSPRPMSPSVSSSSEIVMQKEWVIPPRPKPGRKPAVDTPPTKRKAQNRAAQRAFRERRAAKVGELEERIKEIEEEDAAKTKEMEAQIVRLQDEVERLRGEMVAWKEWKERCAVLDRTLEQERKEKESISRAYNALQETYRATAIPSLVSRNKRQSQAPGPSHQQSLPVPGEEGVELIGCGNCTLSSHCECIAQAINIPYAADDFTNSSKRPHSPPKTSHITKRLRNDTASNPEDLETDFTALYSSGKRTAQPNTSSSENPRVPTAANSSIVSTDLSPDKMDMCGFCQDGTPCICADLSLSLPSLNKINENNKPKEIPTPFPQFTPPPSDTDVTLPPLVLPPSQFASSPSSSSAAAAAAAAATAAASSTATEIGPCANGPGTCAQCRADPNSTLFCKSLAAFHNATNKSPSNCCGGSAATESTCCQASGTSGVAMLSCADTYQALSRHPGYELASDKFGSWLNRLNTSSANDAAVAAGRPAMEVEAASVMGVLKLFDRRFGRE